MKPTLTFIALALILGLISCKSSEEGLEESEVFQVSFDNCKTSIDLKLSDLIEDARLIPLETTQESLIGDNPRFIISDDYIIVFVRDGVYKFSAEGRFIRKLIDVGRAPQEIRSVYSYFFYEKENLLFFDDRYQNPDFYKVYDIENEGFLDPLKKCFPGRERWGSFLVYNDSLIMASIGPITTDTNRYALFTQNFQGELISGIANSRKIIQSGREIERVQRLIICPGDKDIYAHYVYDDTLFRYQDNQLFPYVIVSYNTPRDYIRTTAMEIGESRVNFPQVDNSHYMILRESIFQGLGPSEISGMNTAAIYERYHYFLNKSNGSFAQIKSYTDDITGEVQESVGEERLNFPVVLPRDKIYVIYQSIDLIGKDLTEIQDSDLPSSFFEQLQEIQQNLDEMDNPVLLVGSIKKTD